MWDSQVRLLLAHRGLALAARWPELTGETQLLIVTAQVTLQAEGHLLVTGAQLLLTPASLVRALDVPMGKGVVVMVRVETATMVPQVSIAAVVGMAAPVCGI